MRSARAVPIVLMLLVFSGCTILENLDEISTLGNYSREKNAEHALVKSIDDDYDALVRVIAQGKIDGYEDMASFTHSFGDPILKKDLGGGTQRWLYRHAIYRLSKDKVYVYFGRDGKMIKWEKLTCPKFF
jgi:hypothetical protein